MTRKFYKSFESFEQNQVAEDMDELLDSEVVYVTDSAFIKYLKNKTIRGFHGHSLYNVGKYFFRGIFMENIQMRASSLSFNFFLALFPTLLFLITLIGFIPVEGILNRLLYQLKFSLPSSTYSEIAKTINELSTAHNPGLLSFGFLLAIWFSSNAFHTLIGTFNRRLPERKKSNWIKNRIKAIGLTSLVSFLVIASLLVLSLFVNINVFLRDTLDIGVGFLQACFSFIEFIVYGALIYFSIAFIYRYAPATKKKWNIFSAGTIMASSLVLITTFLFTFWVNYSKAYSSIYGSIGSIIALQILIYINVMVIIVGFELNTSIQKAQLKSDTLLNKKE
jgi:membrane protein